MTDQSETPGTQPPPQEAGGSPVAPTPPTEAGVPPVAPTPPTEAGVPPVAPPPVPPASSSSGRSPAEIAAERPELAIGAAFAGGFLLAMILKRLAR